MAAGVALCDFLIFCEIQKRYIVKNWGKCNVATNIAS